MHGSHDTTASVSAASAAGRSFLYAFSYRAWRFS